MPELSEVLRWSSVSLLGAWFLLSLIRQIDDPRIAKPLTRLAPFHLIPLWRLFNRAPLDCRLWLRDRGRDDQPSAWFSHTSPPAKTLLVWNPSFLPAVHRHILVMGLARHLTRRPSWCSNAAPWGQMSLFYVALENYLRHLPGSLGKPERQFAIMFGPSPPGSGEDEPFYVSPFFDLVGGMGASLDQERVASEESPPPADVTQSYEMEDRDELLH